MNKTATLRRAPLKKRAAGTASTGTGTTRATGATRARTEAAAPALPARSTLTPETWIDAATSVLVDKGIEHVRVDVLARQLEVTRGSFYWHFRSREELLQRVLQAWSERSTEQLTRRLKDAGSSASARLRDVISLPFRGRSALRAARIELAIRAWARRDEMARRAVDEADESRLAYHALIFGALGFAPAEARHRAFLLYSYEVAESLLQNQGSSTQRQQRRSFVERLVRQPLLA